VGGGEQNHYLPGIGSWVGSDFKEPRSTTMPYQGKVDSINLGYWVSKLSYEGKTDRAQELEDIFHSEPSRIEIVHSSFKDPGPDWNRILVDGVCWGYEEGF